MRKDPKRAAREQSRATELIDVAEALSPSLLSFTVPLYQANSKREPEVVGSGVLVAVGQIRFLFTAGHVLDRRESGQLVVGVSPELYSIAGRTTRLRSIGATTPEADKIDTGVVRLEGGLWDMLGIERFLPLSLLDTEIPIVARQSYALIGFPHSVNRKALKGDRINAGAYRMAGLECDDVSYAEEKVDPESNVMIGFEKKTMWDRNGQRTAPDLYGASGSGLWRFGRRIRSATATPKLSAIATEWHARRKTKYVLGTRITLILGALIDKYEDVPAMIDQEGHK